MKFKAFLLILLSFAIVGCSSSSTVSKKTLMSGDSVTLNKDCFGAVSQESYDKLVDYTSTQNVNAAEQMRQRGQFIVLKSGDTAEIDSATTGSVKLLMKSGNHKGKSIYTFREMVTKN